ncbi:MAG: NAD(FAD)-utilizing dehydrogenase [Parcubacteria group bacterium GW2011_GWC2_38_7]|nr:MAG: NAD(FAD)-utilizing dehydrogenase [Parcubacteria group bacterium GW2011_GWC2_38_7]
MDSKKQDFDIIVVGGGAAGMMSAISARQHHPDKSVTLVERSSEMGRKLLVSGAGRCNLTNLQLQNKPENHFEGTGKPLTKKIFESFGYDAIISFFSDLGVRLAPEKKGEQSKIFPVTQQAKTVLNALEAELKHQGVTILTEKEVINLQYNKKESTFRVQFKNMGESISSQYLILTTGGQTYPMFLIIK